MKPDDAGAGATLSQNRRQWKTSLYEQARDEHPASFHRALRHIVSALFVSTGVHAGLMAMPLETQVRPPVPRPAQSLSIRLTDGPPAPLSAIRDLPGPPDHQFAVPQQPVPILSEPAIHPVSPKTSHKTPRKTAVRPAVPTKPVFSRPAAAEPAASSSDTAVARVEGAGAGNSPARVPMGGNAGAGTASGNTKADGGPVSWPRYNRNPSPPYPSMARKRGHEGTVVLDVFVKENGSVGNLRIEISSGHPMLDQSALDAVRKWKFDPGRQNNRITAMWVKVPVRFSLR